MIRALVMVLLTALAALGVVAAEDEEPDPSWVCPEGFQGQQINVFNWSTYIGETTVSDFEERCGVRVVYDVYDSDDMLINRLRQGNPGFDIVVPSDVGVLTLIREELLEPLDYSNLPNFANIGDAYKNSIFDPGNKYTIPYLSGTIGIGYNATAVDEPITTWDQFFNYPGRVAWIDDSRSMISFGLLMSGFDPSSADPDEIAAARDYLIAHGDNVAVIAGDDGQELLARGEVDAVIEYNGDIFQLSVDCACDDYVYVLPEEGTAFSSGFIGIPVDAPNPLLAHAFIDYLMDPVVAAGIANYTTYPSPNQAAIDAGLIDPVMLENKGIYPDDAALQRLFYLVIPPEAEQLHSDAWDEVKIALSR
ncbi:MAG: spermidine/putrescine ABC transporter substrate-binding protein [Anaerolineae bacterium]|nr:spermidine/putrescine ABC transporter substrate-binding protein [Anaerolineae bacterium]